MTPATVRVSMNFPTDDACVEAGLRVAGVETGIARILRIRNTLSLAQIVASEAYLPALEGRDDLSLIVPPTDWTFTAAGDFAAATDLLTAASAA
jgi:hypothetical protein